MADELHRVTWANGQATFHCDGDRTSNCHYFPDCECEFWTEEHETEHPRVEHDDECWILAWLQNIEVECTWQGGDGGHAKPAEHDGPIKAEWEADCEGVLWDYADPEWAVSE